MSAPLHHRSAGRRRALLLLGLALTAPGGARADEATPPTEKIEQIVITGIRRPVPISQVGTSLTVIDAETLELEQKRDAIELLRDVPSFNIGRIGSRGGASSVFVRGGESDQNLILIDGVQVNRGGGAFDLANLSTDGIERVEVLRGPASALYGTDAMASVVQLVTRRGEGPMQGSLRAAFGSDKTYEVGGSVSGGTERLGYALSAGRYATDGVHGLNNDADNSTFRTRLDYQPADDWTVKLTASYSDGAFDSPNDFDFESGLPRPTDPDQGRKTHELFSGLEVGWNASERLEHRFSVSWADAEDLFFDADDSVRGNFGDFQNSKTDQDEDRFSGEYRLIWNALAREQVRAFVTIGSEYERERFDQRTRTISPAFDAMFNPILDELGNPVLVRSPLRVSEDRRTSSAFLQTDWTLRDATFVTLGGRLDDNSEFGTAFSPIVSVAHVLPGSNTRLRAAFSRGFKAPRFDENFDSEFAMGNLDLDPEKSKTGEIGVEQSFLGGTVQTALTYFRTDYDDLIGFVELPPTRQGDFFGTFENVQEVRSQGIEAEVRVALSADLRFSASYTRLRTRVRDGGSPDSLSFRGGEELLRRPTHSGSAALAYRGERLDGSLRVNLLGPREDIGASSARTRNDARVTVDVATSYLVHTSPGGTQTRLTLKLDNLLDDDDDEVFGFESPDFQVLAGVELRF
jgi:vitamin B12 transporter